MEPVQAIVKGNRGMRLNLPSMLRLDGVLSPERGIVDWLWECPSDTIEVCAPEGPIEHVEPAALAAIAAWSAYQRRHGRAIRIHDSVKSPYTWRFGLLSALEGSTGGSARTARFLPATQIAVESQVPHGIEQAISALQFHPLAARGGIAKSLSEALRNVFEHARAEDGAFIAVSYFPNTDRISLAVADTGVGVPATIRPRHGYDLSDAAATPSCHGSYRYGHPTIVWAWRAY